MGGVTAANSLHIRQESGEHCTAATQLVTGLRSGRARVFPHFIWIISWNCSFFRADAAKSSLVSKIRTRLRSELQQSMQYGLRHPCSGCMMPVIRDDKRFTYSLLISACRCSVKVHSHRMRCAALRHPVWTNLNSALHHSAKSLYDSRSICDGQWL